MIFAAQSAKRLQLMKTWLKYGRHWQMILPCSRSLPTKRGAWILSATIVENTKRIEDGTILELSATVAGVLIHLITPNWRVKRHMNIWIVSKLAKKGDDELGRWSSLYIIVSNLEAPFYAFWLQYKL
jgi:hypothetical protein